MTITRNSLVGSTMLLSLFAMGVLLMPVPAQADGVEWGYTDSGYTDTGSTNWGYTDSGYSPSNNWGYTDSGYTQPYTDWGYTDSGYTPSNYGPSSFDYYGPSSFTYTPPSNTYSNNNYSSGSYYQPTTYYTPPTYYNYDYSYDSYDYTYQSYTCAQFGQEGTYPNCHTHQNPTCADSGKQGTYPDCGRCNSEQTGTYPNCHTIEHHCPAGQTGTYPNCHTPQHTPVCDISANDSSIDQDESTVLHWTSENADSATLTGFGSVSTAGSKTVSPNDDTTYTLRVTGDGGSDTCEVTVHVRTNENLSCELTASDRSIDEGDDTRLHWTIDGNATYASINEGVGRVDEDGGSETVSPDGDTTYRLTVRDDHGNEDTCSVSVNVNNDNNFSSVAFTGTPVNNPPVVYLSSIPYTGLEDIDPVLLSYWLMLIAAAAAGVWFLYRKGMIPQLAFASASAEPTVEGDVEETTEQPAEVSPEVMAFLSNLEQGDHDAVIENLRDAAVTTGVEEFLADAEVAATDADLQAKVSAALEASRHTGIRGAKEALA